MNKTKVIQTASTLNITRGENSVEIALFDAKEISELQQIAQRIYAKKTAMRHQQHTIKKQR